MTDLPPPRTRKPTGRVAYPFVLLEGAPKGGKSFALAALASSPRVGRTFVLELGEIGMDEYASLGPFEMVVTNGTFSDARDQVLRCLAVPQVDGKPNVMAIDSGTALWTVIKDWTDQRARNSKKGRQTLASDPDAEIDAPMNLWNDAKARWRSIIDPLMAWDGIAVVVARGSEKAKVENGQPVANQTEYVVEAEKNLVYDVTAQVRFLPGQAPRLVAVKSLFVDVPSAGLPLPREATLDNLIFDILSGGKEFGTRTTVVPQVGVPVGTAKTRLLAAVQKANPAFTDAEAKAEAGRLWTAAYPEAVQEVTTAALAALLKDLTPPEDPPGQGAPETPQTPSSGPGEAPAPQTPPEAPGEPETPPTTEVPAADVDAMVARVRAITKKQEIVPLLEAQGLSTTGTLQAMKDRLIEAIGQAPFGDPTPDPAEAVKAAFPGAETVNETADQGDAESEAAAIPADAWTGTCLCGEAVWHVKGRADTLRHVDPNLDADHQADVPF